MPHYELSACPACGGADTETVATQEELLREMEELWSFHARRLKAGTPLERLADRVVFSQHPPLRVGRCGECRLVFRNPRETERDLVEGYAEEEHDESALQALFLTQKDAYRAQAARLTRLAGRPGSGLEVGSYVGAFLAAAAEHGWDFHGLDINANATRFACDHGFQAAVGSFEELARNEAGERYAAIAIWNTFEQLPDPRAALIAARALLAPGGLLALRVPNGAFYAALRRRLQGPLRGAARMILAHNNLLGFPYRHGFSPASLSRLLREFGLEVVLTVGDALVPIADEWTRGWAAAEERATKVAIRSVARVMPAPWFEIYARKTPDRAK